MFADDGCLIPNIRNQAIAVGLAGKCEHAVIRAGVILLRAPNPEAASDYVSTWLRIPRTVVIGAAPWESEPVPFTDDQILDRAAKILTRYDSHAENAAAATCMLRALDIRQGKLS